MAVRPYSAMAMWSTRWPGDGHSGGLNSGDGGLPGGPCEWTAASFGSTGLHGADPGTQIPFTTCWATSTLGE
jgi:hypothetical protein